MMYLALFFSFFQIGLFSFGGGYAAMPLIQEQVVEIHHWLDMAEFTDLVTISQMTPGPIALNAATFVGIKTAGVFGAVMATAGCMLPSCVIVTLLARLYLRYRKLDVLQGILKVLRPAVIALIFAAGLSIIRSTFMGTAQILSLDTMQWHLAVLFLICVWLLRKKKASPIQVMLLAGVLNVCVKLLTDGWKI